MLAERGFFEDKKNGFGAKLITDDVDDYIHPNHFIFSNENENMHIE